MRIGESLYCIKWPDGDYHIVSSYDLPTLMACVDEFGDPGAVKWAVYTGPVFVSLRRGEEWLEFGDDYGDKYGEMHEAVESITEWRDFNPEDAWFVFGDDPPPQRHKRAPKDADEQLVYLIDSGDMYKIGISKNPTRRMRALESQGGRCLELVATMPGGSRLESELHNKFSALRTFGEWFLKDDSILSEYRNLGADFEHVEGR